MASAALHALGATAPKDLTRQGDHGRSKLHELVIQCQAAGLLAAVDGSNEVALLHALFSVALQNGLGSMVYDYVVEVAADKYCTSSNPIKAYLLDGECVKAWSHNALEREQTLLLQGLSRGLASLAGVGQLHKHVARLGALVPIIEALHPASPEGAPAQLPADLQLAQQLHQCAMVLEWAAQHVQGVANGPGRFESDPAWRMAVSKRRSAAAPDSTFLQDMQQALAEAHGCGPMQYPPASVEKAVQGIFLTGATARPAWQAKLAMLVYYLLDAGLPFSEQSFMLAFHVRPAQLVEWTAYFQLDDALAGSRSSLESICHRLSTAVGPDSSFKIVQSLAALGRPVEALKLLRARQAAPRAPREPDQALHEARVSLSIRLSCNLLTEAFIEAQQHCSAVHPEQRVMHVRELVGSLADWAEAHKALNAVIQLPLNQLEEQMLVDWLKEGMQEGRPAGRYLVLLYLVRGRLPEALKAFRELRSSLSEAKTDEDDPLTSLAALLESASALVPEQARAAAAQLPGSREAPQQQVAQLFCNSLLPKAGHGTQPQNAWPKSSATLEVQPESSTAAEHLAQATPQRAQQTASAAGASEGGASWAAWRADQRGEEPGRAFGQHMDGLESAEGEQGAATWQHIIGPPGSRSAARTVKRPRVHRPR